MRPLVPVLIAFVSGMLLSERFSPSYTPVYVLLALSVGVLISAYVSGIRFRSALTMPAFFFLGALFIMPYSMPELPPWHIRNLLNPGDTGGGQSGGASEATPAGFVNKGGPWQGVFDLKGKAASLPEFDGRRTRLIVDAAEILTNGSWQRTAGRVRVTIEGEASGPLRPGDQVRMLARLREPENYGNPGEFDFKRRLNFRSIFATAYVKHAKFLVKTGNAATGPGEAVYSARDRIRAFLDRHGGGNREVFKALILGEKKGVDEETREAFIRSGTAHILAISGLHVGIVAFAAYLAALTLLKRSARLLLAFNVKKAAAILTVPIVLFYGAIAGFPVSTQRSVIMAAAIVFTVVINRGREYYNILALAALAVLAIEPYALWDASFQLTFSAVLAIIYLTPRLNPLIEKVKMGNGDSERDKKGVKARLKRETASARIWSFLGRSLKGRLWPAFVVTLAASIGTYPILAWHFNRISPVGLLANLVAVPGTGLVVPLLFLATSAQFLYEGLGVVFLYAADALFTLIVLVIRLFSALPYASVYVTTPTVIEITLFYLLVIAAINAGKRRIYAYAFAALVAALVVDYGYWRISPMLSRTLRATFISVGQGDSALVEFPGGRTMLIDGGGFYNTSFDTGERLVGPLLLFKKIKRLDYVVLSHAQRDHMAGLAFVIENFDVGEFWWNGVGDLRGLKKVLKEKGTRVRIVDAGSVGLDVGGVLVSVLHPLEEGGADKAPLGINDSSIVMKLSYGARGLLFTGDIGRDTEAAILRRAGNAALASDVLKAPHHGSRSSSSRAFLKVVSPKTVVVSAGRANPFGLPHEESLENFKSVGSSVLRTDLDGAIEISTDGAGLESRTYGR
jgi:competence protein ComEC